MKRAFVLMFCFCASAAAAKSSGVVEEGRDGYRIMMVGRTGFVSSGSLQEKAYKEATAFCAAKSMVMETISMDSKPARPFGGYPEATLRFRCIKRPASATPAEPSDSNANDKYSKIERLKSLLDSGAITQAEYDSEKAKILSE